MPNPPGKRSWQREFVAENRTLIQSIQRGCELMNLSWKSFYLQKKEKSPDKALEGRIADICLEFSGYGYRRVTWQLDREGWRVNHKKVERLKTKLCL